MNYVEYWNNVYQNKVKFVSNGNDADIPWDIKQPDPNLCELFNFGNKQQGKVLEIGCGSGFDSKYLASLGFDVIAIDVSEEAIQIAKKHHGTNDVTFLNEDFFYYEPSVKFDIIYDRGFLHNYKNEGKFIFEKLSHITNDCGKYIVMTGNPHQQKINTSVPSPVYISEMEYYSFDWFKIILAKEITFNVIEGYENSLGYLFVFEKKNLS